jgi:multiple sugar transport system permease protein/raffinose/stachyose/melibiose transport system permease protein
MTALKARSAAVTGLTPQTLRPIVAPSPPAVIFGWAFTGLPMIFYYAGIADIPKETLDAARIEGAGHLKIIRSVALPQLRPVTAAVVLLTIFESLKAFDLVVVLTKGAPFGTTNVLGYLIYNESFWNS